MHSRRHFLLFALYLSAASPIAAQSAGGSPTGADSDDSSSRRIFGIIPNYRTAPLPNPYVPLTTGQKFKLATEDAFDRGTVALAAVFAGEGMLTNAEPSFGQGVKGYAHYFATSYADWAGADYWTEAIYPTLLHQDPRYFRKGEGSGLSRLAYAMGQIFWTHTDSGGQTFNFSEIAGNCTMVAISQAYYPDHRTPGNAAGNAAIQIGDDMAANILKEFYPDLRRKLSRKHKQHD